MATWKKLPWRAVSTRLAHDKAAVAHINTTDSNAHPSRPTYHPKRPDRAEFISGITPTKPYILIVRAGSI